MKPALFVLASGLIGVLSAAEPMAADKPAALGPGAARAMVARALPFLRDEGVAWMNHEDRGCVSCHQIPAMLWSFDSAARIGLDLDRQRLSEWWEWSLDWRRLMSPGKAVSEEKSAAANSDTYAFLLLGRPADSAPDTPWVERLREHILNSQQDDGSWKPQGQLPLGKRPANEIQEVSTMWIAVALNDTQGESGKTGAAIERARTWLASAKPGKSTEWWVLQLLMQKEFGGDSEAAKAADDLVRLQREDGGWGWRIDEPSDAFGTGMALYGLARAGTPHTDAAVQRAFKYLRDSQQENGSWQVPSTRAKDKNKVRPTSTYWGTAWAVVGMAEFLAPRQYTQRKLTSAGSDS